MPEENGTIEPKSLRKITFTLEFSTKVNYHSNVGQHQNNFRYKILNMFTPTDNLLNKWVLVQTCSYKIIKSCAVMYRREKKVNNIVITLRDDRLVLDLLWWSHSRVYKCQINMLYIGHGYKIVCQLYFNKIKF